MLHCAGLQVRRQAIQLFTILMKLRQPTSGKGLERLARGLGIADRLIVDVGNVANVVSLHSTHLQHATQDIVHHEGAEVSNVRRTIDRGSAAVEPKGLPINRL